MSGHVVTGKTLTSQAQGTAEAVRNLPSKSSILDAARKNALEILNGADGGYVTFETNAQDQITELRIANNLDFSQATKCWRWNLGGLAYMSRELASDDWEVVTAATMDGGFVADFITAGTIRGITISGNTIDGNTITGGSITSDNGNSKVYIGGGNITVYDSPTNFFHIYKNSNSNYYVALGSDKWACQKPGSYIELNAYDIFEYLQNHI